MKYTWTSMIPIDEQIHFAERLSFLSRAHIPLLASLRMIRSGTSKKKTIFLFDSLIEHISRGQSLAHSLSHLKCIFSEFIIHIIHVGEVSGLLSENLHYVSLELKKRHALVRKIRGALLYPLCITVATIGITALLMFYIFPKIMPIFKSMHVKLPLSTKILLFVNDAVSSYWLVMAIGFFVVIGGTILLYKRSGSFNYGIDFCLMTIPGVKKMVQSYNSANFCRTAGLLLKSNIPITEVIIMCAKTSQHMMYQKAFYKVVEAITSGATISSVLEKEKKLFPSILVQMVTVGETTGSLSESFLYLSELYEAEVDEFSKNISTAIEPILMLSMGLVVGFVAVSIIAPIYEITQNLHA